MAWFFLILTILNLPLLAINFMGNDSDKSALTSTNLFTKISLGNIGHSTYSCNSQNETYTKISCKNGIITQVLSSGISNSSNYNCEKATE